MVIIGNLCDGCGKCVAECPKSAIVKSSGVYAIDAGLCDNCDHYFDVECVRVCDENAITRDDGTIPVIEREWRLRSEHLIWLIAVIGSRGNGTFPAGILEWDAFRRLISAAIIDPGLKVRLTRDFDDICAGCPRKTELGHPENNGRADAACFDRLGIEPGTVMRLWDAVKLVEDTYSPSFIGSYPDYVLRNFYAFLSPDAKFHHNA
jgi:NAD-dependent dihydropyrimidine dehydrogenase PreA subunit